jgi:sec-independent protein translocase protein TatC
MALVPFPSKAGKAASSDPDPDSDWDDDDSSPDGAGKMSFLEHLDELRKRIIWALGGVVAGFVLAVGFLNPLYLFVIGPMHALLKPGQQLIFTDPTEALMIKLKIAVIAGILIASPLVMTQVWLFIAPGLYSNEKKAAVPFVLLSSALFIVGAAFAHYYAFPLTYQFMASFSDDILTYMPRIEPTFSLWMKLVLTFGLVFQMPSLVLFLSRLGLVTAGFLWRNFKYAVLIIAIIGAVLSPGTDPVGQLALSVPMVLLYVLSIALAWIFGKKRKPAEDV